MTDEAKALVERVETLPDTHALPSTLALLFDLRDCIETQAREIERLQAAHREIVGLRWNTLHRGCDVASAAAKISRVALAGDSHD